MQERLLTGFVPGLQAAIGAGTAWALAGALGHERPLFAPIAALLTLGAAQSGRFSRSLELTLGVALGILAGDLVRAGFGDSGWSIALAVLLAIGFARLLDERPLMLTQAGISAMLAVALDPHGDALVLTRLVDAGLGAAVAVVVGAVVFPPRPARLVDQALTPVQSALSAVLGETGDALAEVDTELAEQALAHARGLDDEVVALDEALDVARETLLTRPLSALDRRRVAAVRDAAPHLDLAVRNARVLARAGVRLTRAGGPPPADLLTAIRELQAAPGVLLSDPQALERRVSEAVAAGSRASAGSEDLALHAVVAQVRSLAVDLLRAAGLEQQEALDHLATAVA